MPTTKSEAFVGLAMLSALALCAFAAPGAQANPGTTAVTCVKGATKDFADERCEEGVSTGTGEYGHEAIAVGTKTKVHAKSTKASITLSSTLATIKTKVVCTGMTGTGFLKNEEPSGGSHTLTGTEISLTYTGCDMKIGKTEVTCGLKGGEVSVPSVKAMDVEEAHGFAKAVKFEPTKGTVFANFTTGPECPSIGNQTFVIEGSAVGAPHGATVEFTEASTKPTLTLGGNAASFEDTDELRMINEKSELEGPIVATAPRGTTAVTCVEAGIPETGDWEDKHCSEPNLSETGNWKHEAIPVNQKTESHSESTLPSITLAGTIATIKLAITCTGGTGTGFLTNEEPSIGSHTLTGSGISLAYSGCDMKVGKTTCSLKGGEVDIQGLRSMDVQDAHGFPMGIKFEPEKGTTLFTVTAGPECPLIASTTLEVEGSFLGVPHGATLEFTQASTKPTLTLGGNAMDIEDTETLRTINEKTGEVENPISVTTGE
jgi:hypothetical protein